MQIRLHKGFGSQQRLQGAHDAQRCVALNSDMNLIEIDGSEHLVSAAKRCTARAPMPVQNSRFVSIRHRPQRAYLSSVRFLCILMRSTRFSIPKSVKAITPSSPTP